MTEASKPTLTETEVKILTLIDQRFWETGNLISNDKIVQELGCSPQQVTNAWRKESFRQAVLARGVDMTPNASKGLLTPTQAILANMLFNVGDRRSVREKCESVGISTQQYTAWLRQPAFSEYLRRRAENAFQTTDHEAYNNLAELVKQKDFNAIKLFFEMRGIYNPKLQLDVNVEHVIVQLVEIVAKHVTDADTLIAIADEIDRTIELPVANSSFSPSIQQLDALNTEAI